MMNAMYGTNDCAPMGLYIGMAYHKPRATLGAIDLRTFGA
jgi:hypothetical protein